MQQRRLLSIVAAVLSLSLSAAGTTAQGTSAPDVPPVEGSGAPAPGGVTVDSRLGAVLPTAADVPSGLWLDADASGAFAVPGISGYLVTYVYGEDGPAPDRAALLDLPAGTIVLVKCSVQVLSREALTPETLEAAIGGTQAATIGGGAMLDSTTDYGGLPLGEASRARSLYYELQGARVASTAIVFLRGEVIAALNVVAIGDDPAFQDAVRLAQLVDARLAALAAPAAAFDQER